ncbi:MAG TPA: siphovirus Gp157 family protein [Candidatus Choladousia intestinavium]|uniref:Siphovirus Gp157 family protein n=1 Tax=Candidatus Choladousia intestinavium TaxID=2840727 RepID=A0A9D1ABJ3_9FIRM|nr:siphovirus Gp157 family protein [Candidatus Choladousia intestinavium]
MSSLYELTEAYDTVLEMLYDPEVDEQAVIDTLDGIEGEIEDKADNYARLIRELQADADKLKEEEQRMAARRRSLESRADRLKRNLQANLEFIGKTKFKTALFTFSISPNGGLQPLTITENLGEIPGKYLIPQPPVPDKDKIRELLKSKEVEWAHLEPRGKSLRIR